MKIAIIEDETLNYIELRSILTDIDPQIIVSQQLATISEARNYLLSHNDCNLIFADIRLGDGLVFDALADVVGNISVVFTTAYDEYAIRAFDSRASSSQAEAAGSHRCRHGWRPR